MDPLRAESSWREQVGGGGGGGGGGGSMIFFIMSSRGLALSDVLPDYFKDFP